MISSCNAYKPWSFSKRTSLKGISPIGITQIEKHLWISDGDHNRIIQLDLNGEVLDTINGFDRPMHIASYKDSLYVPNYGSDQIFILHNGSVVDSLLIADSLDAPSGISVLEDEIAIADFYNHRILYYNGHQWTSIGKEGHGKGELYYPTDVQLYNNQIYVADAYNNRVQVFNKEGVSVQTMGENENMNASTGIYVATKNEIYITDFENNKVHVYDGKGRILQTLQTELNKPIDLIKTPQGLMVINYKGNSLAVYSKK